MGRGPRNNASKLGKSNNFALIREIRLVKSKTLTWNFSAGNTDTELKLPRKRRYDLGDCDGQGFEGCTSPRRGVI